MDIKELYQRKKIPANPDYIELTKQAKQLSQEYEEYIMKKMYNAIEQTKESHVDFFFDIPLSVGQVFEEAGFVVRWHYTHGDFMRVSWFDHANYYGIGKLIDTVKSQKEFSSNDNEYIIRMKQLISQAENMINNDTLMNKQAQQYIEKCDEFQKEYN